jgi:hypothetical protein
VRLVYWGGRAFGNLAGNRSRTISEIVLGEKREAQKNERR